MSKTRKAFVLLSGGIDSTTCLYLARKQHKDVEALSVFYGQRHEIEIQYAKASCAKLDIPHQVIDLSAVVPKTMLTDPEKELPNKSYAEITGVSPTYVPFRNGLMLAAVASFVNGTISADNPIAEEHFIYFGAHAEDAQNWAYPDCTPEFIGAMANAIYIGSYRQVRLATPLEWLDKAEIIKLGQTLGVDWKKTFSCYAGLAKHCGVCPTCRARKDGFRAASVRDPTEYMM